jgi:hypothetical protein
MAMLEADVVYLKETDGNPLIVDHYAEMPGKRGKDKNIFVITPNGDLRVLTLWGDEWNKLLKLLGRDQQTWTGKMFNIEFVHQSDGKIWRKIKS